MQLVETDWQIHLREQVSLPHPSRAIVTIIDELEVPETARLSEAVLGEDWNRPASYGRRSFWPAIENFFEVGQNAQNKS